MEQDEDLGNKGWTVRFKQNAIASRRIHQNFHIDYKRLEKLAANNEVIDLSKHPELFTRNIDSWKVNEDYNDISLSGFSKQAQKFASAYRIPLIEFNKMPFWYKFNELFGIHTNTINTSHMLRTKIVHNLWTNQTYQIIVNKLLTI